MKGKVWNEINVMSAISQICDFIFFLNFYYKKMQIWYKQNPTIFIKIQNWTKFPQKS